jgi:hypothetical protein
MDMNIDLSRKENLAGLAFLAALIFATASAVGRKPLHRRLFGAFLIFCLAVFADNGFIYSLAVLLIATLITDLEFLENIAAILWKNKDFWAYRKATASEVNAKLVEEARAQETAEPAVGGLALVGHELRNSMDEKSAPRTRSVGVSQWLESMKAFEDEVFNAMAEQELFDNEDIEREMAIDSPDRRRLIADAVAKRNYTDFIMEIKGSSRASVIRRAELQVRRFMDAYKRRVRGSDREVRAIIVVPANGSVAEVQRRLGDEIGILQYDPKTKQFPNKADFTNWLARVGV